MKFIFIILLQYLVLDSSYACMSGKRINRFILVSYPPEMDKGTFTGGNYKTNPSCMNIRFKPSKNAIPHLRSHPTCEDMLPGLTHLENGTIKNLFCTTFEELRNQSFAKIFEFTCNPSFDRKIMKFQYQNTPAEVLEIIPAKLKISKDEKLLSVQSVMHQVESDVQLTETVNDYFFKLSLMDFGLDWIVNSDHSDRYFEDTVNLYSVQLREDVKPNEHIMLEYRKLPQTWSNDVNTYFNFIMTFGTHYRQTSTLGGRLVILFHNDLIEKNLKGQTRINTIINQTKKITDDKKLTPILRTFGGSPFVQNIKNWEDSVDEEPVPLQATYIPLNKLFDNSTSKKSASLSEFISFEMDHQRYKRYLYELKLNKDMNQLAEFVMKLIENQLKYICSSEYINLVIDGIERYNNIHLNKFNVLCHDILISIENNIMNKWIYKKLINLTPKVCFTFEKSLKVCQYAELHLPDDVKCVKLFDNINCKGQDIKVYTPHEIENMFQDKKILSISLCDDH